MLYSVNYLYYVGQITCLIANLILRKKFIIFPFQECNL